MIKFNNSDIIDWNFDDSNIIKVYHNGAIVFYKFDSEQGGYKVCYAVVDDITQYSETEFEDVYDKATEKWYKLNNLNQYEEYGVYGSGRTSCEGSTSRLPQGYTEVEYIENTSTAYLNLGVVLYDGDGTTWSISTRFASEPQAPSWDTFAYLLSTENTASPYYGFTMRWQNGYNFNIGGNPDNLVYNLVDNGDGTSGATITCPNATTNNNTPLTMFVGTDGNFGQDYWRNGTGRFYTLQITKNDTLVRDLVPAKRNSDDKYGMYDIVNNVFYVSPNNVDFSGGEPIAPTSCVTTYDGKLTIDDGYEYEWNGSSWVNLGEISGSSKTSDFKIGDIKERVTTGVSDGDYLLFSYYRNSDISKPENIMSYNPSNNYLSNLSGYGITSIDSTTIIDPSIWLLESTSSANTFYIKSIKNNLYWGYQSKDSSRSLNLVDSSSSQKTPVLITPSCKENCYGFVEKKSNASTGYGGYGLNQLYGYTYQLNWWNDSSSNDPCDFFATDGNADFIIYKMNASDAEYPKYYSEQSEPLDDLTFNTLEDAQAYAEANCVYDGMHATIDGDRYYFDSTDENGWVEDTSYTIWLDPSATNALFSIGHYWEENYKMVITTYFSGSYSGDYGSFWQYNEHTPIELSFYSNGFYYDMHNPTSTTAPDVRTTDYDYRILRQNAFSSYENSQKIKITLTYGSFKAELEETGAVIYSSGSTRTGFSWYDGLYQVNIGLNNANAKCHLSHIQIYNGNNELVNDFKFIKNNGVVGSQEISIYDSVTNTTYNNTNSNTPVYHIET